MFVEQHFRPNAYFQLQCQLLHEALQVFKLLYQLGYRSRGRHGFGILMMHREERNPLRIVLLFDDTFPEEGAVRASGLADAAKLLNSRDSHDLNGRLGAFHFHCPASEPREPYYNLAFTALVRANYTRGYLQTEETEQSLQERFDL